LPARLRLELRDQNLQLRIPSIAGEQVAAVPEPGPIPLSTAEKPVLGFENRRLSAGNLIGISILVRFWRPWLTAEIWCTLRCLAADRQWNSTPCPGLAKFSMVGVVLN
jgi:hypothetical protein